MKARSVVIFFSLLLCIQAFGGDTLYFRLSNPWNTKKSPTGEYVRKCVFEKDYCHIWDFNSKGVLVTESYYTDTTFTRKLFCHKYYNEQKGFLEQTRCYENGRLNGYNVNYTEQGDTASYAIFKENEVVRSWSAKGDDKPLVVERLEEEAVFPNGRTAWIKYLSENLSYPAALKEKISGEVVARVHVDSTGLVSEVEILKSLHPLLDAEVTRVLKNSPRWKPAKQNGKAVTLTFTQPFNF